MKWNEKESLLAVPNDRYSRFTIPSELPVFAFQNAHGERIITIHGDGTVEIAEGLSTDDAARQFWVAVAAAFPGRPECRAAPDAARGEAVAFLYTLEHGASVVARKASTYRLNYPFGGGADYRPSEDGASYVRETPLYAAPPATDEGLADTQRRIIEAAERRGYERRVAEEKGYAEDSLRAMSDWLESGTFKVTFDGDTTHPLLLGSALYAIGKPPRVTFECKQAPPAALAVQKGWKEAAIAWEVCASIHRKYGKGKDALFSTRQKDFMAGAEKARAMLAATNKENYRD